MKAIQSILKEIEEIAFKVAGEHWLLPGVSVTSESDGIHLFLETDVITLEYLNDLNEELKKIGFRIGDIHPNEDGFDILLEEVKK